MSEWWTYSPADFLLFSPGTYYRQFELYNATIWPVQIVALALGFAILALLHADAPWRGRAVAAMLAACWFWIAWAFHLNQYATINWAAPWFALGFALQALLLVWMGVVRNRLIFAATAGTVERVGAGLLVFTLAVQPLIGPFLGRSWSAAELFGVAPDPTVVATLGILLCTGPLVPWALLPLPLLWCAVGGLTLWTMEAPDALVLPAAGLLTLLLAVWRRSRHGIP